MEHEQNAARLRGVLLIEENQNLLTDHRPRPDVTGHTRAA